MIIEDVKGGETAYSEDGRQYTVLAALGDNLYVVTPILLDEDDEIYGSAETYSGILYSEPPAEKYDLRIAQLKEEVASLREEATEWRGILAERARLGKVLSEVEALSHIEDVLAGKITHFVVTGRATAPSIIEFSKAIQEDRYTQRLLTLHGETQGNLQWRINQYRDGSGGTKYEAIPCASLDEAEARLRIEIIRSLEGYAGNLISLYGAEEVVKAARDLGIPVPSALTEALIEARIGKALTEKEKAQQAIAKADEELALIAAEKFR